jgi:FdhD protein
MNELNNTLGVKKVNIKRNIEGLETAFADAIAVEEPLEISLNYSVNGVKESKRISVTMRTPGADEELALGFLFTEGIINKISDVKSAKHAESFLGADPNRFTVELNPDVVFNLESLNRNFYTTSSCGVCGKASIDAIKTSNALQQRASNLTVQNEILLSLPQKLRSAQQNFENTGGIHASGIFDLNGNLIALREDVGRHNALDKLIGYFLSHDSIPLNQHILLLSGRASFELLQKAAMAGIGLVCAIGAPSSLAVETAAEFGIKLIGFLKSNQFNVYTD